MDHWRTMTLILMDAQRSKKDFGMYASDGIDSVQMLLATMHWFWLDGVEIQMRFRTR